MSGQGRTTWAAIAAVAGACAIALVGFVMANANTAERVSANAAALHAANAKLGSAALVRAAAGQVALFESLVDEGVASTESLDAARDELVSVAQAFADVETTAPIVEEETAFLAAVRTEPIDMSTVETAYAPLRWTLTQQVTVTESQIVANEQTSDRIALVLRIAVMLLIPLAVILVYRRRAASQVRQARSEMEVALEAERTINRAKSDFVAGLSHEMRTPLTGIYGFSEILLETVDDEVVHEMVAEIHGQSAELTRMVDDFITMSRLDSESLQLVSGPVDVAALARRATDRFGEPIVVTAQTDLPMALGDGPKIEQILRNFVANALQHGSTPVEISVANDGASVTCDVIDHGSGVAEGIENKLFTRFVHEADEVLTKGSHGLGTWVAASLAERMGGSVGYRREFDRTIFSLRLPIAGDGSPANTGEPSEVVFV